MNTESPPTRIKRRDRSQERQFKKLAVMDAFGSALDEAESFQGTGIVYAEIKFQNGGYRNVDISLKKVVAVL